MLINYICKYSYKNIFIVSASNTNWIKKSLKIVSKIGYYQLIYNILFNPLQKIQIFNPSTFELPFKQLPNGKNQALYWKFNTFYNLLLNVKSNYNKNISQNNNILFTFVSIGDSEYEYKASEMLRESLINKNNNVPLVAPIAESAASAASVASNYLSNSSNFDSFIHRIKLMYHPSINDLCVQQCQLSKICGIFELHTLTHKTQIDINYEN